MRGFVLALGVLLGGAAALPARAAAQATPADTAAVLLDVADRLEAEGRLETARTLYRLILERYAGAPAAAAAELRLAGVERRVDALRSDRSGRVELLVWSTVYGLWLGVALPAAAGADGSEAYGLGLVAGGPTGFLLARSYADRRPLSMGQARAITFGGTWGTWQGFGWREVFDLGVRTETACIEGGGCFETREDSSEGQFAAAVLGGLAGIATGAALARTREISDGAATVVNLAALWGTWFGIAGGVLADLEDDALLGAALVGGDAGLLLGALSAAGRDIDVGRARLVSIAGVAGGLAGAGLDLLIRPDNEKVAALIPAVTSALGLVLGSRWTRGRAARGVGGGRPDDAGAGALLELRDGRWSAGLPLPVPMGTRNGGVAGRRAMGVRVALLSARF